MKLCDVLLTVGSLIVVVGSECIGIGVIATSGTALWELIIAAVIMFGVDLIVAALFMLD